MWIECAENGMNLPAAGRNYVKPEQHPVVIPACLLPAGRLRLGHQLCQNYCITHSDFKRGIYSFLSGE